MKPSFIGRVTAPFAYPPLWLHVGGGIVGGVILGLALATLRLVFSLTAVFLGLGLLAGFSLMAMAFPRFLRLLPERATQVPVAWSLLGTNKAAWRWGVVLGTGVSTFTVTPAFYCFLFLAGLQRPIGRVVVVSALYGLMRTTCIAIAAVVTRGSNTSRIRIVGRRRGSVAAINVLVATAAILGGVGHSSHWLV